MRRVAFVGCRDWTDADAVLQAMSAVVRRAMTAENKLRPTGLMIVIGDAKGADSIAAECARELGIECVRHRADWDRLGKRAGPERNGRIVADCDAVVAFWDGKSRGTLDCITQAVQAGKPVRIVPRRP